MKNNIYWIYLKNLIRGKESPKKIWNYVSGNILYRIYFSKFKFLIPTTISTRFNERLEKVKNTECWWNGECQHCGCDIPQLLFTKKGCSQMNCKKEKNV